MVQTYTCRLYPTHAQAAELNTRLDAACELYNATLRELYRAWAAHDHASAEHAGGACVDRTAVPWAVVDDVVHRAEQAFGAFVSKCQHRSTPGAPPLRARQLFVSITFRGWGSSTRGGGQWPT
jgi:transposase